MPSITDSLFDFAEAHPITFLTLDFSIAALIGYAFLQLEALTEWWREVRLKARKMQRRLVFLRRPSFGAWGRSASSSYLPLTDGGGAAGGERGAADDKDADKASVCSGWSKADTRKSGVTGTGTAGSDAELDRARKALETAGTDQGPGLSHVGLHADGQPLTRAQLQRELRLATDKASPGAISAELATVCCRQRRLPCCYTLRSTV